VGIIPFLLKKNKQKGGMNPTPKAGRISWLDYFFVLRPMLFYPGWSTLLAGYFIAAAPAGFKINWPVHNSNQQTLLILLASFAAVMGSSFILNQLNDIESDRQNNKLFIISNGLLKKHLLLLETCTLTIASIILALTLSMSVALLMLGFFVVTGIMYNYRPLAMKNRPWASLIANIIMGALAFVIGWCTARSGSWEWLRDILPYLFFNTALYLFTTLPDIDGDAQAYKKTLAVMYGKSMIIRSAFGLYLAGFICAVLLGDMLSMIFYALSLPFFVQTIISNRIEDTIRATKFGILFFALGICLYWPPYFLLMVIGFFTTRFYFRRRFNFNYPNFSGT
jgi:4-hydroxybenzoate polyprenyltransferase